MFADTHRSQRTGDKISAEAALVNSNRPESRALRADAGRLGGQEAGMPGGRDPSSLSATPDKSWEAEKKRFFSGLVGIEWSLEILSAISERC